MADHMSPLKTLTVTFCVALVCSVLVAGAAVLLKPLQVANKEAERQRHITGIIEQLPGLGERLGSDANITLEPRVVDLSTGRYADGIEAETFDQRRASLDPLQSLVIKPEHDVAGLKQRANHAVVYVLSENGRPRLVVLPVHGKGYGSTLYGYLGIHADLSSVVGLTFYEHGETPGLGALIDAPSWRAKWYGKKIFDSGSILRLGVAEAAVDPQSPDAVYQVDGITGATWTSHGVTNLLRYWLGENGFGRTPAQVRFLINQLRRLAEIDIELSYAFLKGYNNLLERLNEQEIHTFIDIKLIFNPPVHADHCFRLLGKIARLFKYLRLILLKPQKLCSIK